MRYIYISPHLDDAILSCGGLIWEQTRTGIPTEVWTVCAGDPPEGPLSPFAEVLHAQWGTGLETTSLRRDEDKAACRAVGSRYRHLSIPDGIYRSAQDGTWLYDPNTLMDEIHPDDLPLVETIRAFLAASLKPEDSLACPLTIGGHADHRLTRAAVEALMRPLSYYADVPYVLNQPSALEVFTTGMQVEVRLVTEAGLLAWQEGIAAYTSQIGILFENSVKMEEMIRSYWQANTGTRLWRAA